MAKYIMAIDQGTTSTRAIIYNYNGEIVSSGSKEIRQYYEKPGWVMQCPDEIYESVVLTGKHAIQLAGISPNDIEAIGIANQRETTILWNKDTGEPVYGAISWQCRRTSDYCVNIKSDGFDSVITKKTGLIVDPYFSATKIKWIIDNIKDARELLNKGNIMFGNIDTWLLYKLTGKHKTDYTNASRTMLYNIDELKWDKEILSYFDIPAQILPEVCGTSSFFGETEVFGGSIPVTAMAGDQQAALFGHKRFEEGQVKNTYGTGCFIVMNTGNKRVTSENNLISSIAWKLQGEQPVYMVEGSVFTGGQVIKWLRDSLQLINDSSETDAIAQSVESANGVYFVPAFSGLGAPNWNPNAKGIITGLTSAASKAHIVRAALEAIAYQSHDILKMLEKDTGKRILELNVDGGATENRFLMQFQSDIMGIPVIKPKKAETTSLGVSFLAGLTTGFYKNKGEIKSLSAEEEIFTPNIDEERRLLLTNGYNNAVKTCEYGSTL